MKVGLTVWSHNPSRTSQTASSDPESRSDMISCGQSTVTHLHHQHPQVSSRAEEEPTPLTPLRSPFSRLSRGKLMMLFMFCICKQEAVVSPGGATSAETDWDLLYPHQVLEEDHQLFGEAGKLQKGRAHLDLVPAQKVLSIPLHSLNIELLTLHMSWNTEPPEPSDPPRTIKPIKNYQNHQTQGLCGGCMFPLGFPLSSKPPLLSFVVRLLHPVSLVLSAEKFSLHPSSVSCGLSSPGRPPSSWRHVQVCSSAPSGLYTADVISHLISIEAGPLVDQLVIFWTSRSSGGPAGPLVDQQVLWWTSRSCWFWFWS